MLVVVREAWRRVVVLEIEFSMGFWGENFEVE